MSDSLYPTATYRLQFNSSFRLSDATALIDYLATLGITDIYASPILTSRKGSQHGYDVTDPTQIDPDIGSAQEFAQLQTDLLKRGMRFILDIVPNHMAASSENRWWMDVLEHGHESRFASYFDIDWHPPSRTLDGKVLLPVLGRPFAEVIDSGELRLVFQGGKFFVRYFETTFPLAPSSYHRLLTHRIDELKNSLPEDSPAYQEYLGIVAGLSSSSESTRMVSETDAERRIRPEAIRERLQALAGNAEIAKFIEKNVADLNGNSSDPASLCLLEHLLREQNFRLAYWLDPNEGINYRRFFAISDLVGVRAEDPVVFEATHDHILRLTGAGAIRGFRVDHIDGLRDPVGYLNRLQEHLVGSQSLEMGPPYVLVEKILSQGESLPDDWPVAGTTGYEYLNLANGLFVYPPGAQKVNRAYFKFLGKEMKFADVTYEKKKLVMNTLLRVEMQSLGRQLADLAAGDRYARNLLREELMDVLIEVTACLSVYRTYVRNLEVPASSKRVMEGAIDEARVRRPRLNPACFAFLHDVLTLSNPPHILSDQREERLAFVMRWQQFTGPIVAKGVEDTALYVYYPLLSLNEVGGNPEPSSVGSREDFFEFMGKRQQRWPDTLNATSTHDTKRSEDLRARLNVLSEIPDEWESKIAEWSQENQPQRQIADGRTVPDANEEYLIYQTLLGLWPADLHELPAVCERLQIYVVKAIREAMVHTRWTEPNVAHETAICNFVERILLRQDNQAFLCNMARFHEKVAYAGMINGLGQTLLKIACPGVPDFYQGSELWDYHLVDPDNRYPVDFRTRNQTLKGLMDSAVANPTGIGSELLSDWPDGRIKLYVIWKALGYRRLHSSLFREGEFLPLEVVGDRSQQVISFMRRKGNDQAIAVIPRWAMNVPAGSDESARADFWRGTNLLLPRESPKAWHNVFTTSMAEARVDQGKQWLAVGELLENFPVGLWAVTPDSAVSH
jgi:(1->4)-alpha-D-glucan 1-alpha-D-glucosylmutase